MPLIQDTWKTGKGDIVEQCLDPEHDDTESKTSKEKITLTSQFDVTLCTVLATRCSLSLDKKIVCDSQRNILSIVVLVSLHIYGSVNSSTVNINAEDQVSAAKRCCRTKRHQQAPQAGLEGSTPPLFPKTVRFRGQAEEVGEGGEWMLCMRVVLQKIVASKHSLRAVNLSSPFL